MQFKRSRFRTVVSCAVACLGVSVLLCPASAAYADPPASAALQTQVDAAQEELSRISMELELAHAAADETELQLTETKEKIADLKSEIEENEQKLTDAQGDLSQSVISAYKRGNASLFEILFSSDDFGSLISRVFYANKAADAHGRKIEKVNDLLAEVRRQKDELTLKESELDGLLTEQKEVQAGLEVSVADAQSYMDGLSEELKAALEAERAAEAERQRKLIEEVEAKREQQQAEAAPSAPSGNGDGSSGTHADEPESPQASEDPSPNQSDSGHGAAGGVPSSLADTVIGVAYTQLGVSYDLGAMTPGVAMDCSGLTTYSYGQAGITIPRTSATQYEHVRSLGNLKTDVNELTRGDLVFFASGGRVYHVALYIGGGEIIHAAGYGWGVVVNDVSYSSNFCGGGSPV